MTNPKVSIVIPVYNRQYLVRRAIESALTQTYADIEVIVVDNCSTDGTYEVIREYAHVDCRVRCYRNERNLGPVLNWHRCVELSKGEYVKMLFSDDFLDPEAIACMVEPLERYPDVGLVWSTVQYHGPGGEAILYGAEEGRISTFQFLWQYATMSPTNFWYPFSPSAGLFRSQDLRSAIVPKIPNRTGLKCNEYGAGNDFFIFLRCCESYPYVYHVDKPLVHFSRAGVDEANQVDYVYSQNPENPDEAVFTCARAAFGYFLAASSISGKWKTLLHTAMFVSNYLTLQPQSLRHRMRQYSALFPENYPCCNFVLWHPRILQLMLRRGWPLLRMYRLNVSVPVYLPGWLYRILRILKHKIKPPYAGSASRTNLLGDRDIEWSWVTSQMPTGPGEALDFGPGGSHLALIAAQRGFNVTAVDLEPVHWPYVHPGLRFIQGDILKLPLPKEHFDLVINCSTVEHVGLARRYGVTEQRPDGDLEAMARLWELMKAGGVMLLTIPVGRDAVFAPLCRIYGKERLPRLLDGYIVEKEVFWVKDQENRWVQADKETALNFEASAGSWDPLQNVYALGCFVLRKPDRRASEDGEVSPGVH